MFLDFASHQLADTGSGGLMVSDMPLAQLLLVEIAAIVPSALRSARLPVNLTGAPIKYANRLIGSPITPQSTDRARLQASTGQRESLCRDCLHAALAAKVAAAIRVDSLIGEGDRVLLALSGGERDRGFCI